MLFVSGINELDMTASEGRLSQIQLNNIFSSNTFSHQQRAMRCYLPRAVLMEGQIRMQKDPCTRRKAAQIAIMTTVVVAGPATTTSPDGQCGQDIMGDRWIMITTVILRRGGGMLVPDTMLHVPDELLRQEGGDPMHITVLTILLIRIAGKRNSQLMRSRWMARGVEMRVVGRGVVPVLEMST